MTLKKLLVFIFLIGSFQSCIFLSAMDRGISQEKDIILYGIKCSVCNQIVKYLDSPEDSLTSIEKLSHITKHELEDSSEDYSKPLSFSLAVKAYKEKISNCLEVKCLSCNQIIGFSPKGYNELKFSEKQTHVKCESNKNIRYSISPSEWVSQTISCNECGYSEENKMPQGFLEKWKTSYFEDFFSRHPSCKKTNDSIFLHFK